jgi:Acetyltransferase (GNAT) domain
VKIIERSHIDVDKWNSLVEQTLDASFFSYSWYMDAVSENWCVLVDGTYSNGIVLPYSKRAGLEVLYSPIFGRYCEILGALSKDDLKIVQDRFKVIEFASRQSIMDNSESKIHQIIVDFENRKVGSQAKRSLKKAEKSGFQIEISDNYSAVLEKVRGELNHKFTGITEKSLDALEQLFKNAKEVNAIKVFNVVGDQTLGGIVCFESKDQLLYVKGAVDEETKLNGGMYLALNAAIEYAKENKLKFDFGGSNVEGVKRFNHNLGGVDESYFMHVENNGPAWFKLARKIKSRLLDH